MTFATTTGNSPEPRCPPLYGNGNGDFVTVRTGNSASIKKAGTVILTGYAPGTNNMFGATPITKFVTVSKAPLTVTGDDFSINAGGNSMPTLTYVATGWKNGDNEASGLTTNLSMSTDATNSGTAGTFAFARVELPPTSIFSLTSTVS